MPSPLRLLPPGAAPSPTRTAPRPHLLTAAGRFDPAAVMCLAHALARADVAHAASRGRVRRYRIALPASHAAILAERTAALMIDSGRRMMAEVAVIDARALALGVRL